MAGPRPVLLLHLWSGINDSVAFSAWLETWCLPRNDISQQCSLQAGPQAGWSPGHGSVQILPLCDALLLISSSTSFSASTANATMFADLSRRPVFKSLVNVSFSPTTARAT